MDNFYGVCTQHGLQGVLCFLTSRTWSSQEPLRPGQTAKCKIPGCKGFELTREPVAAYRCHKCDKWSCWNCNQVPIPTASCTATISKVNMQYAKHSPKSSMDQETNQASTKKKWEEWLNTLNPALPEQHQRKKKPKMTPVAMAGPTLPPELPPVDINIVPRIVRPISDDAREDSYPDIIYRRGRTAELSSASNTSTASEVGVD